MWWTGKLRLELQRVSNAILLNRMATLSSVGRCWGVVTEGGERCTQCRCSAEPCKHDGQVGDAVGMAGPLQIIKRDQKAKVHQKAKNKTKQNPKNNSQQFNRSNIPFIFLKVKLLRIFQG